MHMSSQPISANFQTDLHPNFYIAMNSIMFHSHDGSMYDIHSHCLFLLMDPMLPFLWHTDPSWDYQLHEFSAPEFSAQSNLPCQASAVRLYLCFFASPVATGIASLGD